MKQIARILLVLAALALVAGPAAAQANFGKYVALGDSLTAGYLNGGLIDEAQERSYPALIARQAGIGDFELPLVSPPGLPPLLSIQGFQGGSPIIRPRSQNGGRPLNLTLQRPYDNLAVPGFDTIQILQTVSDPNNPLGDLILRGLGTQLQQALVQQPTFVTVWAGNNDVLGAALSGRAIEGVTLTPVSEFATAYNTILGAVAQSGAQMAVANIPDVTALAYVNTVPTVLVNPATGQPVLGPDGNPIPLIGPNGPIAPGEKLTLPAAALLAGGFGIPIQLGGNGNPLPDDVHLSNAELNAIRARTNAFNAQIAQAAENRGAALVDIHGFFNDIVRNGFGVGGITYTTDFLTGGIFSYDGVHPTPFAYAVVANLFIDAINEQFNDDIPQVDLLPFIFGPDGSAGATIPLPGLGTGAPVFAGSAYESVRKSLGVPSAKQLDRLEKRRERKQRRGRR
jgi:lysophospholipase L1-like esterase